MASAPRIAAWLSLAIYMLAATAPCAISPFDAAMRQSLAAAEASGVVPGHHSAGEADRPAPFMRAQCPCSCKHRPHAAGVPTAPGYALHGAQPEMGPQPFELWLAPAVPAPRAAPPQTVEPIPV